MSNERSQYNGQNGNGYQPLYGAPTPPPGPEVGAPTLADVQPGGRVRLGGQRSDLVPGIVRCAKCAFQLHRTNLYLQSGTVGAGDSKTEPCPNGCGPLWPVTWETWAREGWAEAERLHLENAALSAQPSPGGQGDASHYWPEVDRILVDAYVAGSEGDEFDMIAARTAIHAALAARQQVCGTCTEVIRPDALTGTTCRCARQPVGEPVAYLDLGAGGYMDVGTDLSDDELAALPKGRHMLGIIGTYGVDGYKPAQAVDLGELREMLVGWKNSDYPFSYEGQCAQRALNACIADLQDWIDSQVVGK